MPIDIPNYLNIHGYFNIVKVIPSKFWKIETGPCFCFLCGKLDSTDFVLFFSWEDKTYPSLMRNKELINDGLRYCKHSIRSLIGDITVNCRTVFWLFFFPQTKDIGISSALVHICLQRACWISIEDTPVLVKKANQMCGSFLFKKNLYRKLLLNVTLFRPSVWRSIWRF